MKAIIIQTTYSEKKEAMDLAKILLEENLCACVQIQKIDSFYKWSRAVCEDEEYIVNIKTKKSNYKEIKRKIKENHSYDLPEIIAIEIADGSKEYIDWIDKNC